MAQVKFYSVSNLPASPNDGGVYFVDGGELYKGSQRFGLPRVTTASTAAALSALTSKARGDINVGYQGAKVWDGTSEWLQLGDDPSYVTNLISGLVSGDGASYITHITKDDTTGKLEAHAAPFNKTTAIRGISAGTSGSGTSGTPSNDNIPTEKAVADAINLIAGDFDADISELDARVDVLEAHVSTADGSTTIYADAGNIGTITADTFYLGHTVGASTIPELVSNGIAGIAEATASSSSHGIIVSVTTQSGSVKAVEVDATAFDNVMHFLGTGTVTMSTDKKTVTGVVLDDDNTKTPVAGDIVLDTTKGLEVVCTGVTAGDTPTYSWELIGDQNTYAIKADVDTALASKAQIGDDSDSAYGFGATITLTSNSKPDFAIDAAGVATTSTALVTAATNASTTPSSDRLVTAKAVKGYVDAQVTAANWHSTATSSVTDNATITVTVSTDDAGNEVSLTTTGFGTAVEKNFAVNIDPSGTNLPTEAAVATYVADFFGSQQWASTSWAYGGGGASSSATDPYIKVTVDESAASKVTLETGNFGTATKANVLTASIANSNGTNLTTEGQVVNYVTAQIGALDSNVSSTNQSGLVVSVTQTDGKVTSVSAELLWLDASGSAITTP